MTEDEATREYYESLLQMFTTTGWDAFKQDMEAGAEQLNLENCKNADEFWVAKGKAEVFRLLAGYENFIKDGYDAQNV